MIGRTNCDGTEYSGDSLQCMEEMQRNFGLVSFWQYHYIWEGVMG